MSKIDIDTKKSNSFLDYYLSYYDDELEIKRTI